MHNNIADNDYVKKTVALFCEGIIELDINLKSGIYTIPVSLEKSLNIIKALTLINNIEFDSSLKGVYELISKPLKDWNMPFIENAIDNKELLDIVIYNKKYKLMSKYRENGILSGAIKLKSALCEDDIEEYFELNKPFYELRGELTQEDYEIFRTFMQDKSLLEGDDVEKLMYEISSSTHAKKIKDKFIVPLDESLIYDNTAHLCVNCGFPMRKNSLGELVCNFTKCTEKKKISDIDLNANIEFKIQKGKRYYTLSNHAQKYMKIPGIAEKELKEELLKLKMKYKSFDKLEIFPKKDTVDFKVTAKNPKGELYNLLDVKDYLSPEGLAKMIYREHSTILSKVSSLIESKSNIEQSYKFLIIIPDYLVKKDENYEKKFKNALKNISGSNSFNMEIYSVKKYIKYLSKKLKEFDKEVKEEKEKNQVQMNLFNN